jgi:hypothetical protein
MTCGESGRLKITAWATIEIAPNTIQRASEAATPAMDG